MITSLFAGFNHAVRAMQHAQYSVGVHSQNIAHATDPTYTRRTILPQGDTKIARPGIVRLRDIFIDDQYRNANSFLGQYTARSEIMTRIEDIFGDPVNGGLRQAIDQFFDKWKALAENPQDGVARIEVMAAGQQFTQQIKSTYQQLTNVEDRINEQVTTKVQEVNTQLERIFVLNRRITELNRHNLPDAELRDERDAALDELANLTGATSIPGPDATVRVFIGSIPVIDGPTVLKLKLVDTDKGKVPVFDTSLGQTYEGQGALSSLVKMRDNELVDLKEAIDTLGKSVATQVNALHTAAGGIEFFSISDGPASIEVNRNLEPAGIVASSDPNQPLLGDVAREISNLADAETLDFKIMPNQKLSPRTFYRNLVGWIGTLGEDAIQMTEIAKSHLQVSAQQRSSEWGVSLDEEAANLSLQQRAFQAASRVITVTDDMLDTLINRTLR